MNDNIDDQLQSADDRLEESRDNTYQPVGDNKLPEDNDPPTKSSQDPGVSGMPIDHPITDVGLDEHEAYDQGDPNLDDDSENKI